MNFDSCVRGALVHNAGQELEPSAFLKQPAGWLPSPGVKLFDARVKPHTRSQNVCAP